MRKAAFLSTIAIIFISGLVVFTIQNKKHTVQAKEQTFAFVVKDNKLIQGTNNPKITKGDSVTFIITADVDGELHLHGYDKHVNFIKNKPGKLSFTANLTGHFPYELEDTKTEIGALDVLPN